MSDDLIIKYGTRAASDPDDGTVEFVMSDESVDAVGDVINANGWLLDRMKTNPVALYGHSQSNLPIGRWEKVRVEGKKLLGRLRLAEEGTSDYIDAIRRLLKQKMINAVSVGFRPVKAEPLDEKDPYGGTRYLKQTLLECSLVAVPANPNAVALRMLDQFAPEIRSLLISASGTPQQARAILGKSAIPSPLSRIQTMSLSERIQAKQNELIALQDQLAPLHQKLSAGDDLTDDEAAEFDLNAAEIDKTQKELERFRQTEKSLGIQASTRSPISGQAPITAPAVISQQRMVARREKPMELFVKMGVIAFLAHVKKVAPEQVRMELYNERTDLEAVYKAVTNPAATTVATWAAELVETANADWLETLQPMSIYAQLTTLGSRFTFGRNGQIRVPRRNRAKRAAGDLRGAFVGEGQPIPVRRGSFGSVLLTPHKFGVISDFTREMAMHSTPAIENLIREGILEDSAIALDEALLDAAPADAIRPAGLLNGVTPTAGAAGGDIDAMNADFSALLSPFITANAADRLVLLINSSKVFKLRSAMTPLGTYPFRDQIQAGNWNGVDIIASTNVGLTDLIMLRAADFTSASDDMPSFDVSDVATIHEEDGGYPVDNAMRPGTSTVLPIVDPAGVAAKPIRSFWQTATIGIRMLQDVDWAMRRANVISYVNAITW
jgi:HK97 family phage prohead protease/HK97 family phage major capsid protein